MPESPTPNSPDNARSPMRVSLVKGRHRWVFECDRAGEAELVIRLGELAAARVGGFEWFDVALVTHQLNHRLKAGIVRTLVRKREKSGPSDQSGNTASSRGPDEPTFSPGDSRP